MQLIKKILLILCFAFPIFASEKISVLVIHSYSQEYEWTKKQHSSFVSTLNKRNQQFEYYTEYLDTKRVKLTKEYEKNFLMYLKHKYSEAYPELIYVTDDNALNFITNNRKELFESIKEVPVFFSGVNNLSLNDTLPKELFAGVFERKEIKENIELIKQFSPQTREIYIIGDNSNTYDSIKKDIQLQEKHFNNINFHYINDEYISNIKSQLPNKPRSFVVLTTIGNLKDENNQTLQPKESIEKIKENENLIILSMEDAYMYKGVIGGYVTSGLKQGEEAAKLALQYLKSRSLDGVKLSEKSSNMYMFNSKELINSRVILSEYISRSAVITDKHKNLIDDNSSKLLSIFATVLIVLSIVVISIYLLNRKKYVSTLKKLNLLRTKIYIKDQMIQNTFTLANLGYWRLDTKKDRLFVSQELLNILGIDNNIYKDDTKLLEYFIYPNDRALFQKMLSNVQSSNESVTFSHKMVTAKNIVLNVIQTLYTEDMKYNKSSIVIGVIKFEK
jgi:ABC-type uncharacterized transport system substrate-binding protein